MRPNVCGDLDPATWTALCARQDAARANLLALFGPAGSGDGEGEGA